MLVFEIFYIFISFICFVVFSFSRYSDAFFVGSILELFVGEEGFVFLGIIYFLEELRGRSWSADVV